MSEKLKIFLTRKLQEHEQKVITIKRKRKIIKILFTSSIIISIACGSIAATIIFMPIAATILTTSSVIATAFSFKFNWEGKKQQLNEMVVHMNNIRNKLDYVVSCNGDLDENEYKSILKEFTQWNIIHKLYTSPLF